MIAYGKAREQKRHGIKPEQHRAKNLADDKRACCIDEEMNYIGPQHVAAKDQMVSEVLQIEG